MYQSIIYCCLFCFSFTYWNSIVEAEPPLPIDHLVSTGGIEFKLSEDLTIEKVADESLVKWPIVADWDDHGRLVVAESGGVGWPIQEHNAKKLHKIVRLIDSDGDGHFDQRIVAADGLAFPEGVLCLGNEILVAMPPVILRLMDDDDDGVCERREVWFDGTTVTNCANDLHGPYLGRDGWIYWCKGAFGEQTRDLIDGRTITSKAAHIYRRRFSGGLVEPLISGGMDNPVEVAFTPEGESFFTSTFLVHPGNGQRDGIGHAVYGGVFGKDHHVIDDLTRTGPLMQPMTHLGPAAPSGLIYAESVACKTLLGLQRESRTLVAALFNLHKLTTHELVADGASYRTVDRDLVTTDRVDFHPTDVVEDADGSLLIIDTGGWYDLCCPTSRVDQKTASGGVYRVSLRDPASGQAARMAIDKNDFGPDEVVDMLFDPRPWARRSASRILPTVWNEARPRLIEILVDSDAPLDHRQAALWALCRSENKVDDRLIAEYLQSDTPSLKLTALHCLSIRRFGAARARMENLLVDESLLVRRAAAEALGRIGDQRSAQPLLNAYGSSDGDRHLEHSLVYALIEIARRDRSIDLVAIADTDAKLNAALMTLRQVRREDEIGVSRLFASLESEDSRLRLTVAEIMAAHPEWAAGSLEDLNRLWRSHASSSTDSLSQMLPILVGWNKEQPIAALINEWIATAESLSKDQQQFLAANLSQLVKRPLEAGTAEGIGKWLAFADSEVRWWIIDELANLGDYKTAQSQLADVIERGSAACDSIDQRHRWLSALPSRYALTKPILEQSLVDAFLSKDANQSLAAARVLAKINVHDSNAQQIAKSIDVVPVRHLSTAIEVVQRSADDSTVSLMLDRLPNVVAARTLPDGFLVNLFRKSSPVIRERAASVASELVRPTADVQADVAKTLAAIGEGDPVRGLQVFRGSKAACSACHRMGYIGNNVGPELTHIGSSRTREALMEAILFPNSRQEQSYQSTQFLTLDGNAYNGIVKDRRDGKVVLQLAADKVVEIATDEIELEKPSGVSIMPSGLRELLTASELADLLSLLQAAK